MINKNLLLNPLFMCYKKCKAWSTMTEPVGNETIENSSDFCLGIVTTHWPDFLNWDDIKNILGYAGYVYTITKINLRW
jgi:hypothetical protein